MSKFTAKKLNRNPIFDKNLYGKEWEDFKKSNPLKGKVCEDCGGKDRLQRHHIKSVINGGMHALSNIKILCEKCHTKVHPHMQRNLKKY